MPPKKFDKKDILNAAYNVVRREGWAGLSARNIAHELNASTQPIYSYLKSMETLEEEVVKMAYDYLYQYMTVDRTGDPWIDHGVGYIMFAKKEKHLFRCLYEEKYAPLRRKYDEKYWKKLAEILKDYPLFTDLDAEQSAAVRRGRMLLAHGLAALINSASTSVDDEKEIYDIVKYASRIIYLGVKAVQTD